MPKLKRLKITRISTVDQGDNPAAAIIFWKRKGEMPKDDKPTLESLTAQVAKVTEDLKAQSDRAEAAETKVTELETRLKGDPDPDPLAKIKDPVVRELVAKAQAEAAEAKKEAEESRKAVAKMAEDRQRTEFIAKAGEFKAYGEADDLGPMLQKISNTLGDTDYEALTKRMRAVQAQVDLSKLLAEVGDAGESGGGSAHDKLTAIAKGYVKDGKFKNEAEAYEEAMVRNTDLAEAALKEEG